MSKSVSNSNRKSSVEADDFFDSARKSRLRRKLLDWFAANQRQLPWRKHPNRYRVWVSEIMLQQTQVATVINYFQRFMKRFPNVRQLASANEQEVLKLWEGLGYYRRARQLHRAAQIVVEEHAGKFPSEFDQVLALPGIGRYTASAILSIADHQRLPILEGNTLRLFARLLGSFDDISDRLTQEKLWAFSESLLPRQQVGDFNQALMELGALVCRPQSPDCEACPVAAACLARLQGIQEDVPVKGSKTKWEKVREAVVLVVRQGKILLRQADSNQRWAGMWDFPRYRLESKQVIREVTRRINADIDGEIELVDSGFELSHTVTRFRIQLSCFVGSINNTERRHSQTESFRWFSIKQLDQLALNVTARKIANAIEQGIIKT